MCLSSSSRRITSAGVAGRPRVLLFLQSRFQASCVISSKRSSSRTESTCRIQGSQRSSERSAIKPAMNSSPKSNCARWVWIMRCSVGAFARRAGAVDCARRLVPGCGARDGDGRSGGAPGELIGMEGNLTGLAAGIVYVQHPLAMALARSAGGAGDAGGMEGAALEQGAAQQVLERRELGEDRAGGRMRHLYRCYTRPWILSIHFYKKCFERIREDAPTIGRASMWPSPYLTSRCSRIRTLWHGHVATP